MNEIKMNKTAILFFFILLPISVFAQKKTPPACVDFLTKWKMNNPKIVYKDCTAEPDTKEQPKLFATYEVAGKDAKIVEKYLTKKFGMKNLVFECCGWAPRATSKERAPLNNLGKGPFKDKQYINPFLIYLTSGETTEKDWKKIKFQVKVETNYTEI